MHPWGRKTERLRPLYSLLPFWKPADRLLNTLTVYTLKLYMSISSGDSSIGAQFYRRARTRRRAGPADYSDDLPLGVARKKARTQAYRRLREIPGARLEL